MFLCEDIDHQRVSPSNVYYFFYHEEAEIFSASDYLFDIYRNPATILEKVEERQVDENSFPWEHDLEIPRTSHVPKHIDAQCQINGSSETTVDIAKIGFIF
eukprot:gb/GECG01007227.1/.p1 GENE.gb/GECG01007227.1/~~gb/GECG01007227.1/.p1  ORF type:complete len:101 (+),score=12.96 gb/GECG01007227.1/:1-303(+)